MEENKKIRHEQPVIWRKTLNDGTLPFTGFTPLAQEKEHKALQKGFVNLAEFEGDLVTTSLCKVRKGAALKEVMYCRSLDCLVQLKKQTDEGFKCRLVVQTQTTELCTSLSLPFLRLRQPLSPQALVRFNLCSLARNSLYSSTISSSLFLTTFCGRSSPVLNGPSLFSSASISAWASSISFFFFLAIRFLSSSSNLASGSLT